MLDCLVTVVILCQLEETMLKRCSQIGWCICDQEQSIAVFDDILATIASGATSTSTSKKKQKIWYFTCVYRCGKNTHTQEREQKAYLTFVIVDQQHT